MADEGVVYQEREEISQGVRRQVQEEALHHATRAVLEERMMKRMSRACQMDACKSCQCD